MEKSKISIEEAMEIVSSGGIVRTGIDVYTENNLLLLSGDHAIDNVNTLLLLKIKGITGLPVNENTDGGIWDQYGNKKPPDRKTEGNHLRTFEADKAEHTQLSDLNKKIKEINELKQEAREKYEAAKKNIIKVINDIKDTGGEFDYDLVENTVTDIFDFITRSKNAFSYLTKELFSYDDYLYNHCLNVCIFGTAVVRRFNDHFSSEINKCLEKLYNENTGNQFPETSFLYYLPEDLYDISIGFFLHDIGKVMIPEEILNRKGPLAEEEFETVKRHSFEYGIGILNKNGLKNPFISNIVKYHHSVLFKDEEGCYPKDRLHIENPAHVKICRLVDMYDAMTSKRCYKDAINSIEVVTELFRKYAHKDRMLQLILHSFVNTIGIYPPGSFVFLRDGRMAYILESEGPIVIPFTDTHGPTSTAQQDPIDLSKIGEGEEQFNIDRRKPGISPAKVYGLLPSFLKESIS